MELEFRSGGSPQLDSLDNLFARETWRSCARMLLRGESGSGKTMLLKKSVYYWAAATIQKESNQLPLVLRLPVKTCKSATLLDNVFQDLKLLPDKFRSAFKMVLADDKLAGSICLAIDGFDEKNFQNKDSEIYRLVMNEGKSEGSAENIALPKVKVLVSCRLSATPRQCRFNSWIILTGVSSESQLSFAQHNFQLRKRKA